MASNAVLNQNQRCQYQGFAADVTILAAADPSATLVTCPSTAHTIFVTSISLSVTTDHAATQVIEDSAGTPVVIAKSKASPGLGPIEWAFGEDGTPLTEGKNLVLAASGAGLGARLHIEGYIKQTSAISVVS